jgi:hypothetical protein
MALYEEFVGSKIKKVFPSVKIVRNSEKIQSKSSENLNQFFYNIQLCAFRRFLLATRSFGKNGRIMFITLGPALKINQKLMVVKILVYLELFYTNGNKKAIIISKYCNVSKLLNMTTRLMI